MGWKGLMVVTIMRDIQDRTIAGFFFNATFGGAHIFTGMQLSTHGRSCAGLGIIAGGACWVRGVDSRKKYIPC